MAQKIIIIKPMTLKGVTFNRTKKKHDNSVLKIQFAYIDPQRKKKTCPLNNKLYRIPINLKNYFE